MGDGAAFHVQKIRQHPVRRVGRGDWDEETDSFFPQGEGCVLGGGKKSWEQ